MNNNTDSPIRRLFSQKSVLCGDCQGSGGEGVGDCIKCRGWGTLMVLKDDPRPEWRNDEHSLED